MPHCTPGRSAGDLDQTLRSIMTVLCCAGAACCAAILLRLTALGDSFSHALAFCVVLLVASVPIAMRVICNTTMALGCRRMADAGALREHYLITASALFYIILYF